MPTVRFGPKAYTPLIINQASRKMEPCSIFPKSKFLPNGSQGFGIGIISMGFFNGFLSVSSPVSRSMVIIDFLWSPPNANSPTNHIIGGGTDTIN